MNKTCIYLFIIILFIILINKIKYEKFMDIKSKSKILEGIKLNFGEIENLDSLEIV